MTNVEREDLHQVVRNDEDQYAIVPMSWQVPTGWLPTGRIGSAAECERWVDEVWTDLRPASQRGDSASGAATVAADRPR